MVRRHQGTCDVFTEPGILVAYLLLVFRYYSIGSSFTAITCLFYFQSYKDIMEQGHYLHNTSVQIGVLYAIFVATAFTYGG